MTLEKNTAASASEALVVARNMKYTASDSKVETPGLHGSRNLKWEGGGGGGGAKSYTARSKGGVCIEFRFERGGGGAHHLHPPPPPPGSSPASLVKCSQLSLARKGGWGEPPWHYTRTWPSYML